MSLHCVLRCLLYEQALFAFTAHNMPINVQLHSSNEMLSCASSPSSNICIAGANSPVGCHWTPLYLLSRQECLANDPCHGHRRFLEPYCGCLPVAPVLNHQARLLCSLGLHVLQLDSHWWCTAGCSQGAQCLICYRVDMPTSYPGPVGLTSFLAHL